MQLNARMDVDLVAVEEADEVTVMLDLQAPEEAGAGERPPAAVQVVLDRSGSMRGPRLDAARRALAALVDRLGPGDRLGVVAFDDQVRVVLPAGPLTDKAAAKAAVLAIESGGQTNLSAGLLRGLQEARRASTASTLLLLSDGLANTVETDPARLAAVAAGARAHGITISTIGIGLGYDETLLAAVARGGQGAHAFAEEGDAAAAAVAGEVEGLLSKTVQAASLVVRPRGPVAGVTVWNDLPAHVVDGALMGDLGDLWSGEQRRLLLTFNVPAMAALGLAEIATLELRYVALPGLVEETVTLPLYVNVVPGDEAAGRVRDPEVHTEVLFQQTQEAKRRAADALASGDHAAARQLFEGAGDAIAAAPPPMQSDELLGEAAILADFARQTMEGEAARVAKRSRMEQAAKARKRGRRPLDL
jgi:Ca-activated chloride channel family protein